MAVVAAVVVTVRIAVVPEIAPTLQAGALLTVELTAHDRDTLEALSPPVAVMVMVEVLEAPAVTDEGESAEAASVNAGTGSAFTTWLPAGETLAR